MAVFLDPVSATFAVALLGLVSGGGAAAAGVPHLAAVFWSVGAGIVLLRLLVQIAAGLRKGETGLDVIAALAMGGALVLGEPLAGVIVGLMYAGGQVLERYAAHRAGSAIRALVERAPLEAELLKPEGSRTVAVASIRPGDRIHVRPGEVVPVDGRVEAGRALLDESVMTGESLPVVREAGTAVTSGTVNAGSAFVLLADRAAADSAYAGVLRLVETAQASKAPFTRLAERYSLGFLLFTVLLSGAAWLVSGDPRRALAVLVVATPCPLILAVPVALVAGLSRAASLGMLVKTAGALEALARVDTVLVDKTGTLTVGRPAPSRIIAAAPFTEDEVLRFAASVGLGSRHVVSAAAVDAARARGIEPPVADMVREVPGEGVRGIVEGHDVAVGGRDFIAGLVERPETIASPDHADLGLWIAVDGLSAGAVLFFDPIRPEAAHALIDLRRAGVRRVVLVTGDRREVAEKIAEGLSLDGLVAGVTPQGKVDAVLAARSGGRSVAMIGDGINDAPALAAADIGIALAGRGGGASAEAADAVLVGDRLERVAPALLAARRAVRVARQSVLAGIALSGLAMVVAAAGYIPPVAGALLQEAIDVAVVLNALRALGPGAVRGGSEDAETGVGALDREGGVP